MGLSFNKIMEKVADHLKLYDESWFATLSDKTKRFNVLQDLCRILNLSGNEVNNLNLTIRNIPEELDKENLIQLLFRVYANSSFLEDMEIPVWDGTKVKTDIRVLGVGLCPSRNGKRYLSLYCRALTDLPAGMRFTLNYSENMISYMFGKYLGIGRKIPAEYTEIGGMYFSCVIENFSTGITAEAFSATPLMKKKNKELQMKRAEQTRCATHCGICSKKHHECVYSPFL